MKSGYVVDMSAMQQGYWGYCNFLKFKIQYGQDTSTKFYVKSYIDAEYLLRRRHWTGSIRPTALELFWTFHKQYNTGCEWTGTIFFVSEERPHNTTARRREPEMERCKNHWWDGETRNHQLDCRKWNCWDTTYETQEVSQEYRKVSSTQQ